MAKKYYWLKLKEDFFRDKKIKKLRKIAGGDTYTIIYLKMQLLSLKNNGTLIYEGIEESFIEELALDIDEELENVKITLMFLMKNGLLEEIEQDHYVMTETIQCIGSETAVAERVRKHRELKKQLRLEQENLLQCNTLVTNCNTEKREKKEEIDLEIDIEREEDINKDENVLNIPSPKKDEDILKEEFEKLWDLYPKKVGKEKAFTKYKKYRTSKNDEYCTYEEVLKGLETYLKYIKLNSWYSPKDGSTWFNNKSWNDEYNITEIPEETSSKYNSKSSTDRFNEVLDNWAKKQEAIELEEAMKGGIK